MRIVGIMLALALMVGIASAATVTIRPDGQGNYAGWTANGCSGGSSEWQCVDEAVADTTDYLSATGTGRETFSFGSSGLSTESINSVTLYYYLMQHNSAANSCIEAMIRSGGVNYDSGNQLCSTTNWTLVSEAYTTNPATGSAWTVANVDALEAGMVGSNPNGGGRVAQVYAVVDYVQLQPDLIIDLLSLSKTSAVDGETVTVTVRTKNVGTASTGVSSITRVANGGNNDFNVSTLAVSASQTDSFNYTCGTSNVVFTATADLNGDVSESNEANNGAQVQLNCTALPDLVIDSIAYSTYLNNSATWVNVTTTVKNQGAGNAAASTTRLVGLPYTWDRSTSSLASMASTALSWQYACTSNHWFNATADIFSAVTETNEGNNAGASFITC